MSETVDVRGQRLGRLFGLVFLVAITFSALGDEVALIAVLLRLAGNGDSVSVAALLLVQLLPMVVLAPLAGQLLDRRDAGRVLAVVSAVQALVLGAMAAWPTTAVLLAGTAVTAACAAVVTPAVIVLMPIVAGAVAGAASPARANALLEVSRNASTIAGPLIGGVLVAVTGVRGALLADAITFLFAAVVVFFGRVRRPVESSGGVWWKGATDGFKYLRRQPSLAALLPVVAITVAASSMINVAAVFFVQGPLKSDGIVFGLVTAAWGAGALIGSVLVARFELRSPERAVLVGAAAMGAAILLYGAVAIVGITVIAALLAGMANSYQNIAMRTSVQNKVPEHLLGRAHAAAGATVNTFFLVGFGISGIFAAAAAQATIVVAGAVTIVAASVGHLWYQRRVPSSGDDHDPEGVTS